MSIEKGKEILGNIPIYHSHIPKFFVMYGKSMLHFIFLSCMLGTNLTLEVNCMTNLTIKSNSLEVAI